MTETQAHADREHATWSASATERNWNCPGALALTKDLPDDTSEAADWGTCAHQIAEKVLTGKIEAAADLVGMTEKGKKYSFEVDEEMADTAQMYVDYVMTRRVDYLEDTGKQDREMWVEEKFSFASLNPPFDAGGTGDCVMYFPAWQLLEIVDLKGGRGVVVEVDENKQLRSYGLGALLAHKGLRVKTVRTTIVQPRAFHKDGRIRSEEFHVADLVEWTADLLEAMRRSAEAAKAIEKRKRTDLYNLNFITRWSNEDGQAGMPVAEWVAAFLKPGNHCDKTFCAARGFCPALLQQVFDTVGVWFDDLDHPRISNTPDTLSPERAAQLLDAADMITGWVNSVRAYWHNQAEAGVEIPNYILVEKEGREKWNDGAEKTASELAIDAGLDTKKVFTPGKIRTPKQLRAEIAKLKTEKANEALKQIAGLSSTPKTGTNLVRATNTTREAVQPSVDRHFSVLD